MKPRSPIRRKSPRRKLAQAIDLKVRDLVFERDEYKCLKCKQQGRQICGTAQLQAAHILPKGRYPRMRFVEENILTLCIGCHIFGWHRDPLAFAEWLESARPGLYERLLVTAAVATRVDMTELAIVYGA